MKKIPFIIFYLIIVFYLNSQDIVKKLIDIIPTAKESEFKTPEEVIGKYFDALNNYNIEEGMKCYALKERMTYINFNNLSKFNNGIEIQPKTIWPNYVYHNYLFELNRFNEFWDNFIYLLFIVSNKDIYTKNGFKIISLNELNPDSKLKEIEKKFDIQKLKKIKNIIIENKYDRKLWDFYKILNISELVQCQVKFTVDDMSFSSDYLTIIVCKINSNWKIFDMQISFLSNDNE